MMTIYKSRGEVDKLIFFSNLYALCARCIDDTLCMRILRIMYIIIILSGAMWRYGVFIYVYIYVIMTTTTTILLSWAFRDQTRPISARTALRPQSPTSTGKN